MQPNARLILYCFIVSAKPGGRNHSGHHGERLTVQHADVEASTSPAGGQADARRRRQVTRLRHRELGGRGDVGARLDDVTDPVRQSNLVLSGLVDRFTPTPDPQENPR